MVHSWKEVVIHELPSMHVTKMSKRRFQHRRSRLNWYSRIVLVNRLAKELRKDACEVGFDVISG